MDNTIKYQVGDLVGPHQALLLKRFSPKSLDGPPRGKGIFECPICGEDWEAPIGKVANNSRMGHRHCRDFLKRGSGNPNFKHGLSLSPYSRARNNIFSRCYNPKTKAFKNYGARDITVCKRWDSLSLFIKDIDKQLSTQGLSLSDWGKGKEQYTLDRKNNNGNYEPSNIRFATPTEQAQNRGHHE